MARAEVAGGRGVNGLRLLVGDCCETLRTLEAESVDCVATSPPYYGLRDYGVGGQIGREPTLQEYIGALVEVFAEVHRALKPEGTVWLNLGDCYEGSGKGAGSGKQTTNAGSCIAPQGTSGLKHKDLMLVPARVAIALQEWGWWLRSEIVWAKAGGGMPESVKDRPSCSHEKIWLLTKVGSGYFYDYEACAQPAADTLEVALKKISVGGGARSYQHVADGAGRNDGDIFERERSRLLRKTWKFGKAGTGRNDTGREYVPKNSNARPTRRLRNHERAPEQVWEIRTAMYPGAHFAVFPPELVERCLNAGCPEGGVVLDPFGGAGTTGLVALGTGRQAILCELSDEYADLARRRVESGGRLDSDMRKQRRSEREQAEAAARGQVALL